MRSRLAPDQLPELFAHAGFGWWIAGGHAIDLWLGRSTRTHEDLDVAVLRPAASNVRSFLKGWDLRVSHDGALIPWDGPLARDRHAVWCRRRSQDPWAFELLFNDVSGSDWVFRRDDRVRRPLASIGIETPLGLPVLAPEIVLLFKAKQRRSRDDADLTNTVPTLDEARLLWLADAIRLVHPGHPWLTLIDTAPA